MASSRIFFLGFVLLMGCALADISIEPINPVVRLGQTTRLMCKAAGPIKSCLWDINKKLHIPVEGGRIQPLGRLQDGECGVQVVATENDNGEWKCQVFVEGGGEGAEAATSNVTLLALPKLSLRPNADPITVIAGQETEVVCVVGDARPAPAIVWMIGDKEIQEANRKTDDVRRRDGLHTITDTLKYTFQAGDHNQMIRCLINGVWLNMEDQRETSATLNVIFPPQPKAPTTLYGFVAGEPGDVAINFTANPQPVRVYWKIDENEYNVEPFDGTENGEFEVERLRQAEPSAYEARLKLREVTEKDSNRQFLLVVESDVNGEKNMEEYVVHISMNAAPAQSGGVSGGGIVGIIIAVIAILVIIAAVLYARNTGRWCFSGTKAVGVSTKESGDEEAAISDADTCKEDAPHRPSLKKRVSSLYDSFKSKTAPKKNDQVTGVGNNGADIDAKDGNIVYAELDLKLATEADVPLKEEPTEYAEIVPIIQEKSTENQE